MTRGYFSYQRRRLPLHDALDVEETLGQLLVEAVIAEVRLEARRWHHAISVRVNVLDAHGGGAEDLEPVREHILEAA